MIDWTDRGEDVLERYKAWKHYAAPYTNGAIVQLMADLATMVESLSHSLAAHVDANLGRAYIAKDSDEIRDHARRTRLGIMRNATDKTGAKLFPSAEVPEDGS